MKYQKMRGGLFLYTVAALQITYQKIGFTPPRMKEKGAIMINSNKNFPVCLVLKPVVGRIASDVFQKLHYWHGRNQGKMHNGERWVFNTYEELGDQVGVSRPSIQRAIRSLKDAGLIRVEKLSRKKSDRTNYYALNIDRLNELHKEWEIKQQSKVKKPKSSKPFPSFLKGGSKKASDSIQTIEEQPILNLLLPKEDKYINTREAFSPPLKEKEEPREVIHAEMVPPPYAETVKKQAEMVTPERPKPTICQDMVAIWNEEIATPRGKSLARLDRKVCPLLVGAFKHKFGEDLEQFRNYCRLIKSSNYLMMDSFSLFLEWAITFKTIERIRGGELGVGKLKPSVVEPSKEDSEKSAAEHIALVAESEKCKGMRRWLVRTFGAVAYMTWLFQVGIAEDEGVLLAPNRFVAAKINERYGHILEQQRLTIKVQPAGV